MPNHYGSVQTHSSCAAAYCHDGFLDQRAIAWRDIEIRSDTGQDLIWDQSLILKSISFLPWKERGHTKKDLYNWTSLFFTWKENDSWISRDRPRSLGGERQNSIDARSRKHNHRIERKDNDVIYSHWTQQWRSCKRKLACLRIGSCQSLRKGWTRRRYDRIVWANQKNIDRKRGRNCEVPSDARRENIGCRITRTAAEPIIGRKGNSG